MMGSFLLPKDIKMFLLTCSHAFLWYITDKPEITTHPQGVTPKEGNNVTVSCSAIGNPSPSITWTKNGSIISTAADSRITFGADNKTLTITNVSRADSGQYKCVASNGLGKATSSAATMDVQCMFIVVLILS